MFNAAKEFPQFHRSCMMPDNCLLYHHISCLQLEELTILPKPDIHYKSSLPQLNRKNGQEKNKNIVDVL